jgi:hypothetical protein
MKVGSLGKVQWQKTFGTGIGESIVSAEDGDFILVATSRSELEAESDIRILKFDKFGNLQWQKTIDRPASGDSPVQIQKASKGGYIIVGYTNFAGTHSDIWVLRIDQQGRVQWQYSYGGPKFNFPSMIRETPDGGWIISAYTQLPGSIMPICWLLKLKTSGEIEWQKGFAAAQDAYGSGVLVTKDGGYAVSGIVFEGEHTNAFVIRLDKDANILWQKMYGGSQYEQVVAFESTNENGFILAGDTGSFTHGRAPNAYILSLDSQGEIIWQNVYGHDDISTIFTGLTKTRDLGYVAFGDVIQIETNQDFWLLKLDHFGNLKSNCGIQLESQMESKVASFRVIETTRKAIPRKFTIKTPDISVTKTNGLQGSLCEK